MAKSAQHQNNPTIWRIFQIQSFIFQTLFITDSIRAAGSVMATSAQHQNKVFFILCFIRSLVFPTTATLLLLGATVYLVFYTFHQEILMGFVPPAMVGLLSSIFLPFFTKIFFFMAARFKQTLLKFRYSVKATKVWNNLLLVLTLRKGQLISKGIFGILEFLQKTNEWIRS